jgi:hypothetical protein
MGIDNGPCLGRLFSCHASDQFGDTGQQTFSTTVSDVFTSPGPWTLTTWGPLIVGPLDPGLI